VNPVLSERLPRRAECEVFDRHAGRYDAWFDSRNGRTLFDSEVRCLCKLACGRPRPWLEIGVGTGRFAEALGVDTGVDPAGGALEYAARRGIRVMLSSGETLPFASGEFGTAFMVATLCFARDPFALLCEARRILRPGGCTVVGIIPAGSPWGQHYRSIASTGHLFYSQARFFTLEQLDRLARKAGFMLARSASTLYSQPGCESHESELPREGRDESAGFVALEYRVSCDPAERTVGRAASGSC